MAVAEFATARLNPACALIEQQLDRQLTNAEQLKSVETRRPL